MTLCATTRIDVSAPFYNSPIPPEGPIKLGCPNKPYFGLWNYEVIELYFLNDEGQYFDIRISPRGRFFGIIHRYTVSDVKHEGFIVHMFNHSAEKKNALSHLPEHTLPIEVHNPCLNFKGETFR